MNGVIIVNTLKKRLFVATTMIWGFSVTLPVLAEYKPIEQPVEPANPSLKIESRNDLFKEKYPKQYQTWADTSKSTDLDSVNYEDPRVIVLWAGYAFAKDYKKPRGHFYAVTDVREILRTAAPMTPDAGPMPMACWSCKSPDVPRLIAERGEAGYFGATWASGGSEVVNPIGCADCHDTTSKDFAEGKPALRIARPYVLRALEKN